MSATPATLILYIVVLVHPTTSVSNGTGREARQTSSRLADASLEQKINGQVTSFIEQILRCRRVPGLSVAVVQGTDLDTGDSDAGSEQVEDTVRALGNSNIELKEPVTPDTAFCLSSCTKAFTTTLLALLLHERGLVLVGNRDGTITRNVAI